MPAGGDNLPRNFSWVLTGKLAGCGAPASEKELLALVQLGVSHLVTLSMDTPPPSAICGVKKIKSSVISIQEFKGPKVEEFINFIELVSKELCAGGQVAVHCRMGRGRTGTMLASYIMKTEGLGAIQAIQKVRRVRPGSVETKAQEEALELFEKHLEDEKKEAHLTDLLACSLYGDIEHQT